MRLQPIVRNGDFTRAYKKGKSYVHPHVVLYVNKNRAGVCRVGITTSKKIGNAPRRSRARRVIRHALYGMLPQNMPAVDIVLVARGQTPQLKSWRLEETLRGLFKKAGLPVNGAAARSKTDEKDAAGPDTGL